MTPGPVTTDRNYLLWTIWTLTAAEHHRSVRGAGLNTCQCPALLGRPLWRSSCGGDTPPRSSGAGWGTARRAPWTRAAGRPTRERVWARRWTEGETPSRPPVGTGAGRSGWPIAQTWWPIKSPVTTELLTTAGCIWATYWCGQVSPENKTNSLLGSDFVFFFFFFFFFNVFLRRS